MLQNLSLTTIIINLIVLGVGMTIHEFSHNYVGWKMGDPEPERQGRLTLNPLVHINWFGWIMFAVIGFGILGSAPIAPSRMKHPRFGYLAAVAAGPISNLVLAALFGVLVRLLGPSLANASPFVQELLLRMVLMNVLLFVFNVLPLFPLDGWHIVLCLLPGNTSGSGNSPFAWWLRVRRVTEYLFFALIIWSVIRGYLAIAIPDPLNFLISRPVNTIFRALLGAAG